VYADQYIQPEKLALHGDSRACSYCCSPHSRAAPGGGPCRLRRSSCLTRAPLCFDSLFRTFCAAAVRGLVGVSRTLLCEGMIFTARFIVMVMKLFCLLPRRERVGVRNQGCLVRAHLQRQIITVRVCMYCVCIWLFVRAIDLSNARADLLVDMLLAAC
jgi:hypothetical protein